MEAKKKARKTAGRPSGAKNKQYMDAESLPAACPRCGSIDLLAISKAFDRRLAGTLPSGFEYARVIWTRSKCAKCEQAVMVRKYLPPRKN